MSIWIVGGDARNRFAAEYFQQNGFRTQTFGVPQMTDSPLPQAFQNVVLPFPSFSGALLRGQSAIPIEEIIDRLQPNTKVFGGLLNSQTQRFGECGATVYELYGSEPLTTCNAVPTAEGAICLAIEHSPITLNNASCLVCGFGRCGKALAERLHALHAQVTVADCRIEELALAQTMGLRAEQIGVWRYNLQEYDFIFNTVPAAIFSDEQIASVRPDCVVIELASAPGAFSAQMQSKLHYLNAPGLPGKYAPKTAGILYAQSILRILESEDFP